MSKQKQAPILPGITLPSPRLSPAQEHAARIEERAEARKRRTPCECRWCAAARTWE